MNDSFEQFHNSWNREHLDAHEKAIIRARLQNYMAGVPLPAPIPVPIASPWTVVSLFKQFQFKLVPAALIAVLLLGSALSAAAEEALPDEALYFAKININEKVKGFFALSQEAQAQYYAEMAERRVEEAARLAVAKRLTPEVKANLNTQIAANASNATDRVENLQKENKIEAAARAASNLEATLEAQVTRLDKIAAGATDVAQPVIKDVKEQVKAQAASAETVRATVEEKVKSGTDIKTKKSAEETKLALESIFIEVAQLLAAQSASTTSTTTDTATTTASTTEAVSDGVPTNTNDANTANDDANDNNDNKKENQDNKRSDARSKDDDKGVVNDSDEVVVTDVATTTSTVMTTLSASSASTSAEVSVHLEAAAAAYTEGVEKLEKDRSGEAYAKFLEAQRALKEAEVTLKTSSELKTTAPSTRK